MSRQRRTVRQFPLIGLILLRADTANQSRKFFLAPRVPLNPTIPQLPLAPFHPRQVLLARSSSNKATPSGLSPANTLAGPLAGSNSWPPIQQSPIPRASFPAHRSSFRQKHRIQERTPARSPSGRAIPFPRSLAPPTAMPPPGPASPAPTPASTTPTSSSLANPSFSPPPAPPKRPKPRQHNPACEILADALAFCPGT